MSDPTFSNTCACFANSACNCAISFSRSLRSCVFSFINVLSGWQTSAMRATELVSRAVAVAETMLTTSCEVQRPCQALVELIVQKRHTFHALGNELLPVGSGKVLASAASLIAESLSISAICSNRGQAFDGESRGSVTTHLGSQCANVCDKINAILGSLFNLCLLVP